MVMEAAVSQDLLSAGKSLVEFSELEEMRMGDVGRYTQK